MLNLALTGHPLRAWPLGRMSNVIGDKSTGKTLVAVEAAGMFLARPPPGITKPEVHYVEGEAAFDLEYARRLGMPVDEIKFDELDTIEAFFKKLQSICKSRDPKRGSLVILDSVDSLTTQGELDTDIDEGTYGTQKSKKIGETFRKLTRETKAANVHLMLISQIRENISSLPFAPKWRRNGGKALDFYASHIIWLHERAKYTVKRLELTYGIGVEANVTKNKVARPFRKVKFPILFDYGIDDIYSMLDFLAQKRVPKSLRILREKGGFYTWDPASAERMHIGDMIDIVDDDRDLYLDLIRQTFDAWDWLELQVTPDRHSKKELLGDFSDKDLEPDPPIGLDDLDPEEDIPQ